MATAACAANAVTIRSARSVNAFNDVGVECPSALDWITGDRLRHSAPRQMIPRVYPMSADAPEPYRHSWHGKQGDPDTVRLETTRVL